MLFDEAVFEYLEAKQPRLRETTMAGYVSAIECHLLPKWAGREIESVTHEELQRWVDSFDLPGAAEKAYKTFRQIYRWTLRKHLARRLPPARRARHSSGLLLPVRGIYRG